MTGDTPRPEPTTTRHAYQYVVLRCVPRADREEFLNVGVVLYCHATEFLALGGSCDPARLRALAPDLDLGAVAEALAFAAAVCGGDPGAGAAGRGTPSRRFGFLKAPRSTVLRPGPVHGGTTTDPAATLAHLAASLVG